MSINEINDLSKDQLRDQLIWYVEKVQVLQDQLSQLNRFVYGSRRERFIPEPLNLPNLFSQNETQSEPTPERTEEITYTRKKPAKSQHAGRQLLSQCTHLPVERVDLPIETNVTGMTKMGELIQEKIAYKPGKLYIIHYVRQKYVNPISEQIIIADPINEPIAKCEADISLLTHILVSKFVDHLPEYRIIQMLKRDGLKIPGSTINGWTHGTIKSILPVGQYLMNQALKTGYIQIDETTIRVQDGEKKNSTHLGYMWHYYSPEEKIVAIRYQKGRGREGPSSILKDYHGFIQTDGYEVYKSLALQYSEIVQVGCMAHCRRYFEQALENDKAKASQILNFMQKLYNIEEDFREEKATHEKRYQLRQIESKPILEQIHQCILDYAITATPSTLMGKAITYALNQWPILERYIMDGRLEIDNNLIENKIRPIALGRKNFLFAGSHDAAERIAIIYSIFGTCKAIDVNPVDYLNWLLPRINMVRINEISTLTPHAFKSQFPV